MYVGFVHEYMVHNEEKKETAVEAAEKINIMGT